MSRAVKVGSRDSARRACALRRVPLNGPVPAGDVRPCVEFRRFSHGRSQEENVAVTPQHASRARSSGQPDLCRRQRFWGTASAAPYRPENGPVSRPPGARAERRITPLFVKPVVNSAAPLGRRFCVRSLPASCSPWRASEDCVHLGRSCLVFAPFWRRLPQILARTAEWGSGATAARS